MWYKSINFWCGILGFISTVMTTANFLHIGYQTQLTAVLNPIIAFFSGANIMIWFIEENC